MLSVNIVFISNHPQNTKITTETIHWMNKYVNATNLYSEDKF